MGTLLYNNLLARFMISPPGRLIGAGDDIVEPGVWDPVHPWMDFGYTTRGFYHGKDEEAKLSIVRAEIQDINKKLLNTAGHVSKLAICWQLANKTVKILYFPVATLHQVDPRTFNSQLVPVRFDVSINDETFEIVSDKE